MSLINEPHGHDDHLDTTDPVVEPIDESEVTRDDGRPTSSWVEVLLAIALVAILIGVVVTIIQQFKEPDDDASSLVDLGRFVLRT